MKNFNFIFGIIAAASLSACGSQSMVESTASLSGSTGSTGGTTTSSSGNIYNLPAANQQRVELGGNNTADYTKTLTFTTSHTLKVKIKPLAAPNLVLSGYTNWVFPYGCLSVSVTVNGMTRGTQTLRVEGVSQGSTSQCASAPTSQVLDFTDVMTGTGTTQVVFSNANYDNCRSYSPFVYGCGMSAVWQNHRAAMDTTVQIDGQWMDP